MASRRYCPGLNICKQCPQDKALAWPICFVTFSTHSLARQTRQTHWAPASLAPWACPAHVQADKRICSSGVRSLKGSQQTPPELPAACKACQVQGTTRQHNHGSAVKRQWHCTQPATAEGRVSAVWALDPPGVHKSKGIHAQPECPHSLSWWLYPGDNHRGTPVKGILKELRQMTDTHINYSLCRESSK